MTTPRHLPTHLDFPSLAGRRAMLLAAVAALSIAGPFVAPAVADEVPTVTTDGLRPPRTGREAVALPEAGSGTLPVHAEPWLDTSTGVATFAFEPLAYEAGELRLPVTLSHSTGGVRMDEPFGLAGIGWELSAGGEVTRSIAGMPDEDGPLAGGGTRTFSLLTGTAQNSLAYLRSLWEHTLEAERDRYRWRAGTRCGEFVMDGGTVVKLTMDDARIERTAAGFEVTLEDGTLLTYDLEETLDYSYTPETYDGTFHSPSYSGAAVCWRLTRVVGPSRTDTARLAYSALPDLQRVLEPGLLRTISATSVLGMGGGTHINTSAPATVGPRHAYTYRSRHALSSIEGRAGSLAFDTAPWNDTPGERWPTCRAVRLLDPSGAEAARLTLEYGTQAVRSSAVPQLRAWRLERQGVVVDGADFTYHAGAMTHPDMAGMNNGLASTTPCSALSWGADGRDPTDYGVKPSEWSQSSLSHAKAGTLKTVATAAGATTTLDYELSGDSAGLGVLGRRWPLHTGLRLKSARTKDANTALTTTRAYSYSEPACDLDLGSLPAEAFLAVGGSHWAEATGILATVHCTTGTVATRRSRLPGAPAEGAATRYGRVVETVTGGGLGAPVVTLYEHDTSSLGVGLVAAGRGCLTPSELDSVRFAGTLTLSPAEALLSEMGPAYATLLGPQIVPGYYPEMAGNCAPLARKTEYRVAPGGSAADTVAWRVTEYFHGRTPWEAVEMGVYCEPVTRSLVPVVGGTVPQDAMRLATDFNHFGWRAWRSRLYLDSVAERTLGDNGVWRTVTTAYQYDDRPRLTQLVPSGIVAGGNPVSIVFAASDGLPRTRRWRCGDESVVEETRRASSAYRGYAAARRAGRLSLRVSTATTFSTPWGSYTLLERDSHGHEPAAAGLGVLSGRALLGGPVSDPYGTEAGSTSSTQSADWTVLDTLSIEAVDTRGNPLRAVRNHVATDHYGWDATGMYLVSRRRGTETARYTHLPLVGLASATTPAGTVRAWEWEGGRPSAEREAGTLLREWEYAIGQSSSGAMGAGGVSVTERARTGLPSEGTTVDRLTRLDARGRAVAEALGSSAFGAQGADALATVRNVDPLGRETRAFAPVTVPWAVAATGYYSALKVRAKGEHAAVDSAETAPWADRAYWGCASGVPLAANPLAGAAFAGHPSAIRVLYNEAGPSSGSSASPYACRRYRGGSLGGDGSLRLEGWYPEGMLEVLETTSPDGEATLEFADWRGRKVLERRMLSGSASSPASAAWADTYWVWDEADRLLFVLTPRASRELTEVGGEWSVSGSGSADRLLRCASHSWTYDRRLLPTSYTGPGRSPVLYVHDASGRRVLEQDASLRSRSRWAFSVADDHGREVLAGECPDAEGLAAAVEAARVSGAYSPSSQGAVLGYAVAPAALAEAVADASAAVDRASYRGSYACLSLAPFATLSAHLSSAGTPSHRSSSAGLETATLRRVLEPPTGSLSASPQYLASAT
ncbi:MAG: hypothetical protein LIO90_09240, partial [Bacteroidales bacterium]|nr:hypothetical protein [Bacteroidales bacterium]